MGKPCTIHFIDLPTDTTKLSKKTTGSIIIKGPKVTVASWAALNTRIYCGHEDGSISIFTPDVYTAYPSPSNSDGAFRGS